MQREARSRWLDIVLLSIAAITLGPIVFIALIPVLLTVSVLWPLLILPIVSVQALMNEGEEQIERTMDSLRPGQHAEAHA